MSVKLDKIVALLSEFRKLDPNLQMQTALAFVYISQGDDANDPLSVYQVGDKLGCTSASASRNVAALSNWSRHNRAGYGLVEANENPERRNEKIITLTPKGKQWLRSFDKICEGQVTATIGVESNGYN
tara:strand:+ start:2659 stop:3042 length:384 start_codon:yes stop_codon:yes gene_type:complete